MAIESSDCEGALPEVLHRKRRHMIHKLLAFGLGVAVLAACSDEQEVVVVEPPEKSEVGYDDVSVTSSVWDADDDELLDQDEHAKVVGLAWSDWDEDADGRLTEPEFQGGWAQAGFKDAAAAFEDLDRDGNAEVSEAEWSASSAWNEWDADESGILEPTEFPYY